MVANLGEALGGSGISWAGGLIFTGKHLGVLGSLLKGFWEAVQGFGKFLGLGVGGCRLLVAKGNFIERIRGFCRMTTIPQVALRSSACSEACWFRFSHHDLQIDIFIRQ